MKCICGYERTNKDQSWREHYYNGVHEVNMKKRINCENERDRVIELEKQQDLQKRVDNLIERLANSNKLLDGANSDKVLMALEIDELRAHKEEMDYDKVLLLREVDNLRSDQAKLESEINKLTLQISHREKMKTCLDDLQIEIMKTIDQKKLKIIGTMDDIHNIFTITTKSASDGDDRIGVIHAKRIKMIENKTQLAFYNRKGVVAKFYISFFDELNTIEKE